MATSKTKDEKVSRKKMNRILIEQKLDETLSPLKALVGEKKFEKKIKKAAKAINKTFPKKVMDSFRKQQETVPAENAVRDDTNLVIEDLP